MRCLPLWRTSSYHFLMKIILLLTLIMMSACGKQSKSKLHPIRQEVMTKFVNDKNAPASPNLSIDKSIVNDKYPFHIALYKDGRFYYDLPRLDDGFGTWKISDGKIILKAKRDLFDMYIEVYGSDMNAENLTIQFTDRFGPNTLKMRNKNI